MSERENAPAPGVYRSKRSSDWEQRCDVRTGGAPMADESSQAPAGARAASPSVAASDTSPFPLWQLFGLGVLSCATWVGAVLLDLWAPTSSLAPIWLSRGLHAALILAVPALILLFMHSPRMPVRRHQRAFFAVMALLALILALPALLPYTSAADLGGLPLRVPTLSLGAALAAIDPLIIERWRRSDSHDSLTAIAASLGFGAAVLAFFITYDVHSLGAFGSPQCASDIWTGCGQLIAQLIARMSLGVCGGGFLFALAGLFGALLGYAIGAWVARSDRWW